jgi:hypothetical protein
VNFHINKKGYKMILNKIVISICLLLLVSSCDIIYGQKISENKLSGNLYLDANFTPSKLPQKLTVQILSNVNKKKSPVLAGVLSGILPGAGEFYTGQYLKAGIFLAVETAAIATALIYNHKGDYETAFFQWYADQHWSPARYAQWTINNAKNLNPSVDPSQYNVFNSNGSINWNELNRLESAIGANDANGAIGGGYSHNLSPFDTYEYYKLIGKYDQFSHGWDTSNQSDTDFHILTPQYLWYAHQRAVANDYYQTGLAASSAIYINHFLSILDAVWSSISYNKNITMNVRVQNINIAGIEGLCPTLNIIYNF